MAREVYMAEVFEFPIQSTNGETKMKKINPLSLHLYVELMIIPQMKKISISFSLL